MMLALFSYWNRISVFWILMTLAALIEDLLVLRGCSLLLPRSFCISISLASLVLAVLEPVLGEAGIG